MDTIVFSKRDATATYTYSLLPFDVCPAFEGVLSRFFAFFGHDSSNLIYVMHSEVFCRYFESHFL